MRKTYTLYFRQGEGQPPLFEPLLCESTVELMERVRELLASRPQFHAVDVYFGETELFQIKQAAA